MGVRRSTSFREAVRERIGLVRRWAAVRPDPPAIEANLRASSVGIRVVPDATGSGRGGLVASVRMSIVCCHAECALISSVCTAVLSDFSADLDEGDGFKNRCRYERKSWIR
jgi:hypothetical protein